MRVLVMGRGGVRRGTIIAGLIGGAADAKRCAGGAGGGDGWRSVGCYTRYKHWFTQRKLGLARMLFLWDDGLLLLLTDNMEICLVSREEGVGSEKAVVCCGCHQEFISTKTYTEFIFIVSKMRYFNMQDAFTSGCCHDFSQSLFVVFNRSLEVQMTTQANDKSFILCAILVDASDIWYFLCVRVCDRDRQRGRQT